jgi:hypothetical protein
MVDMISDTDRAKLEDLFSYKEVAAIDVLCKRLELNEVQVLRQALRLYQQIQNGLDQKHFTSQDLDNLIRSIHKKKDNEQQAIREDWNSSNVL